MLILLHHHHYLSYLLVLAVHRYLVDHWLLFAIIHWMVATVIAIRAVAIATLAATVIVTPTAIAQGVIVKKPLAKLVLLRVVVIVIAPFAVVIS